MKISAVLGLAMLAGAAGCAQGPSVLAESADRVTLRWYRWDADLLDASRVAADRCAARGRRAELLRVSSDYDVGLAEFSCR